MELNRLKQIIKEEILKEIKVQTPGNYGITVDGEKIDLFSKGSMLFIDDIDLEELVIYDRNLEYLYCNHNKLTKLDLRFCPNLEYLHCSHNKLTNLNISNCSSLEALYCDHNQLTSLDLSKCSDLKELYCNDNQLISLNVSNCPNLKRIYRDDNVQIISDKPLNEIQPLGPNYNLVLNAVETMEEEFDWDIMDDFKQYFKNTPLITRQEFLDFCEQYTDDLYEMILIRAIWKWKVENKGNGELDDYLD